MAVYASLFRFSLSLLISSLSGSLAEGNGTNCGSCSVMSIPEATRIFYNCSSYCLSSCLFVNTIEVFEETASSMAMTVSWNLSAQALNSSQVVSQVRFIPLNKTLYYRKDAWRYCYPREMSNTWCNQGDLLMKTAYFILLDQFESPDCVTSNAITVNTSLDLTAINATAIPTSEHFGISTAVVAGLSVLASVVVLTAAGIAVYCWKLRSRNVCGLCTRGTAGSLTGELRGDAITILDLSCGKSSQNAISNRQEQVQQTDPPTDNSGKGHAHTSNKRLTVWLSHLTKQEVTRAQARRLAERLMEQGIDCKSYLICNTEIAIHGFPRVEKLMECVDVVLVCCNNEYIQALRKPDNDNESIAFFHEYLHILSELQRRRYERLAVILLNEESTDCIPCCLQNTIHYKFPDENGFFDLLHRITRTEPNALGYEDEAFDQSPLQPPCQSQTKPHPYPRSQAPSQTDPTCPSADVIYITSV